MIKMTGRTVLVAGQTVLIAGTWSEVGAHSALPAEGPDTTANRLDRDTPTLSGAKGGGHALDGRCLVDPDAEEEMFFARRRTFSGAESGEIRLLFHRPASDADSTRPGLAAVEDPEHFRPGPPACTKAPAPAAPRGHDHRVPPGGAATTTDLLAASSPPHQEVW